MKKIKLQRSFRTKSLLIACLAIIFIQLQGCGDGLPGHSDAFPIIADHINKVSEGRIALSDLRKTDGQEAEMFGVSFYTLSLEGTAEINEKCYWMDKNVIFARPFFGTYSYDAGNDALERRSRMAFFTPGTIHAHIQRMRIGERGEKVQFTAEIQFEKSEQGWNFSDGPKFYLKEVPDDTDRIREKQSDTLTGEDEVKQKVLQDLTQIGNAARAYYLRPEILGGGGRSFSNFTFNDIRSSEGVVKVNSYTEAENEYAVFMLTSLGDESITIIANLSQAGGEVAARICGNGIGLGGWTEGVVSADIPDNCENEDNANHNLNK